MIKNNSFKKILIFLFPTKNWWIIDQFLNFFFDIISSKSGRSFFFISRPKKLQKLATKNVVSSNSMFDSQYAIIMQGPIISDDDFTLETLRFYRAIYPKVTIVYSTWLGSIGDELSKELSRLDIYIQLSSPPEKPGMNNVNYMIKSTLAGLKKASEMGVKFVMRTRSDQRLYSPRFLDSLHLLHETFHVSSHVNNQKGRILGISANTTSYRVCSFTDMLHYGHISDLISYWDCPYDLRENAKDLHRRAYENDITNLELSNLLPPEIWLFINFLNKMNESIDINLKNYSNQLRNRFLIFDAETVQFVWGKYSKRNFEYRYLEGEMGEYRLTFSDWAAIYRGYNIQNNGELEMGVSVKVKNKLRLGLE